MAVLKQRGGAHGQGGVDHLDECQQVVAHALRQPRRHEAAQYLCVGGIAQCHGVEVVVGHELIEDVGAEHHSARYGDGEAVEIVELRVAFDYGVDERQAAPFAPHRPLADACEVGVMVEALFFEFGHHAAVFHAAVFHYEVEE